MYFVEYKPAMFLEFSNLCAGRIPLSIPFLRTTKRFRGKTSHICMKMHHILMQILCVQFDLTDFMKSKVYACLCITFYQAKGRK